MDMFRPKRSPTLRDAPYNPFTSDHPPNETIHERELRLQSLQEAQRVSRRIDADIAESRKAFEKRQKAIKILLLGQAESGKSTVLKNFQLAFTPSAFRAERAVWRIVIQLNLINSVKRILETLADEWGPGYTTPPLSNHGRPSPVTSLHRRLRMSLSPLLSVESALSRVLTDTQRASQTSEVTVRAGSRWKSLLTARSSSDLEPSLPTDPRPMRNDPTGVLAACRQDIITLWEDATVKNVLIRRGIALETSAGFFLNDTDRIATYNYDPTDADILRARVRTMGVEEHHFIMETTDVGSEYYIFDVGGSRSMRPQWIPYFDNMHAILFLAPLAFNQVLEEDTRVNRLEDSLCLWREICCNPLLAQATIILFLNKMDVLANTVAAGADVKQYVPSFTGDNDVKNITKYFRDKFRAYHKRLSPRPRPFMCYETSAIDKKSTFPILDGVRESILRNALERMAVL